MGRSEGRLALAGAFALTDASGHWCRTLVPWTLATSSLQRRCSPPPSVASGDSGRKSRLAGQPPRGCQQPSQRPASLPRGRGRCLGGQRALPRCRSTCPPSLRSSMAGCRSKTPVRSRYRFNSGGPPGDGPGGMPSWPAPCSIHPGGRPPGNPRMSDRQASIELGPIAYVIVMQWFTGRPHGDGAMRGFRATNA